MTEWLTEVKYTSPISGYTGLFIGRQGLLVSDSQGRVLLQKKERTINSIDLLKELVDNFKNFDLWCTYDS